MQIFALPLFVQQNIPYIFFLLCLVAFCQIQLKYLLNVDMCTPHMKKVFKRESLERFYKSIFSHFSLAFFQRFSKFPYTSMS